MIYECRESGFARESGRFGLESALFCGGAAAVIAVLVFRRYFGVELMQFRGFGLFRMPDLWPGSAVEWFSVFQKNAFVGLALFDLFDLVNYALVGLIILALYGALRDVAKSSMRVAMACGFVGIAVYCASNQTFAMLRLSNRFAAATSEAERAMLLSAAEARLASHNPGALYTGTGIFLSLFLMLLAGLIISIVMLRSEVFGKGTAVVGILANGIGLGIFIALAFTWEYFWIFPTFSAPFRMIWYILIAIKLFQLGRVGSNQHPDGSFQTRMKAAGEDGVIRDMAMAAIKTADVIGRQNRGKESTFFSRAASPGLLPFFLPDEVFAGYGLPDGY